MMPLHRTPSPIGKSKAIAAPTGWWLSGGVSAADCIRAYSPEGAASQAASYANLNNPGVGNGVPLGTVNWSAINGWSQTGGGAVNTGFVPAQNYSYVVKFSAAAVGTLFILGTFETTNGVTIIPNNFTNCTYIAGKWSNSLSRTPGASSGVLGISGQKPYRNGAYDGTDIPSDWSISPTLPMYLLRLNGFGSNFFTGYIQKFAAYSRVLSAAENAAIASAM